ncbi:hypothetical protein OE88DRAFT_1053355 [Heliocybe sulcata]|uniref:NTF2 domain-containing protein n=1 Tax=Heliocybe sulcata TaxID=5364 RepID=A0A5C3ML11_9AGAM|nr:hypothetical protein OE88DRAFT_1053355 [Heliocybe sulcata]
MAANDATLISLAEWTKCYFIPLVDRSSDSNLQDAFRLFFSRQPTLFVNGMRITAGGYMALLQRGFVQETPTSVTFENVVVVPESDDSQLAGSVGFFFTTKVNGDTDSRSISSCVNIVIGQDSTLEGPGDIDRRRVTNMSQVILDNGTNPLVVKISADRFTVVD